MDLVDQAAEEWDRIVASIKQMYALTSEHIQALCDAIGQLAAVADETPTEPPPRRCPTHGALLAKGGSCRRCQFGQGQWARDAERRHQQTLRRVRR